MALAYAIPGLITYVRRFEGIFMATPESQRHLQWYDIMYRTVYVPAYTNAGSFLCGLIGGLVYAAGGRRDRDRASNGPLLRLLRVLWWTAVPACVALLLTGHLFYAHDWPKPSLWIAAYAAAQRNVWGAYMAAVITAMALGVGCK